MQSHPLVIVLAAWAWFLVAIEPAPAQAPTDVKAKLRDVAGAKADALIREGKFADAVAPAAECAKLSAEIDGAKH